MKTILFLLSLTFSLSLSAQNQVLDSLVVKYFPQMNAQSYFPAKIIASYHHYYDLAIPDELKALAFSSEEIDTGFQKAVALYLSDEQNFSALVKVCQKYGENLEGTPNTRHFLHVLLN